MLDSSLTCFFLYTCAKVCGRSFFRTSNIHTLYSLVICARRLSVWGYCFLFFFLLCCGRPFFRTRNIHTFFACFFVLDSSLACFFHYTCAKVCGRSFFRTSNIHTLYSLVICARRLSVWGFCYVVGARFLERGIFTHLFRLFLCVRLIFSVLLSLHLCESLSPLFL